MAVLCSGLSDKSPATNGLLISLRDPKTGCEKKLNDSEGLLLSDSITESATRKQAKNTAQFLPADGAGIVFGVCFLVIFCVYKVCFTISSR